MTMYCCGCITCYANGARAEREAIVKMIAALPSSKLLLALATTILEMPATEMARVLHLPDPPEHPQGERR
jgi:hypothetical protein